jgi:hypothetical protein
MRFKIITWNGENATLFYIVDKASAEQPAVVCSYRNREEAEEALRCLNMAGVVIC